MADKDQKNTDAFVFEDFRALAANSGGPCVSIFVPIDPANPKKNEARFDAALKKARGSLEGIGYASRDAKGFLEPAAALSASPLFWKTQGLGLAVFASPAAFKYYRLPIDVPEFAAAADCFHLKPLVAFLNENGRFHLLRLSRNQARLYLGTRLGMMEVSGTNFPAGAKDVLPGTDFEKQLQAHGHGSRRKKELFHGHGGLVNAEKKILQRYFRAVDRRLRSLPGCDKIPLVLAAVDYYGAIYRQENTCPCLLEQGIAGGPDNATENDLHEKAWEIASADADRVKNEDISLYQNRKGTDQASFDIKRILPKAYAGKVGLLLVSASENIWGKCEAADGGIEVHDEGQPGDCDLSSDAAAEVLLHRGAVHVLPPDQMPDKNIICALFRR